MSRRRFAIGPVTIACAAVLALPATTPAQEPKAGADRPADPRAQREALGKLDFWFGRWEGDGWVMAGPGQRREFAVVETVEPKLDGLVLLVEGRGTDKAAAEGQPSVGHHALALVSYDPEAKQYRMRYHRMDGRSGDAPIERTDKGFRWGFRDAARGVELRFTTEIDGDRWREVGEASRDGQSWNPFMEMTLTRQAKAGTP